MGRRGSIYHFAPLQITYMNLMYGDYFVFMHCGERMTGGVDVIINFSQFCCELQRSVARETKLDVTKGVM